MIHASIAQMAQMLRNLSNFLKDGAAMAEAGGPGEGELLDARLAPDMFNLVRQVQSAADGAKFAAARLAGVTPPRDPDDETTMAQLQARLARTIEFLDGFKPEDFEGASTRRIQLPFMPGHDIAGEAYFLQFAQPNFYFHVTTAYAILRHKGVALGKQRFIGRMSFEPLSGE